jgi:hypothetical protein
LPLNYSAKLLGLSVYTGIMDFGFLQFTTAARRLADACEY